MNELPFEEGPELVGLHANASINFAINESNMIVSNVLGLTSGSGDASSSSN